MSCDVTVEISRFGVHLRDVFTRIVGYFFFMVHSIKGVLLKNSDGTLFVPTLLSALTVNLLLDVKSMVFYHLLRFAHVNGRQPLFH